MPITRNSEEILVNAMTYFIENTQYCYKVKLFKLLYHFDFEHYRQTGFSATGMRYEAWKKGPVSRELYNDFSSSNSTPNIVCENFILTKIPISPSKDDAVKITPKNPIDLDVFTPRQKGILKQIAGLYRDTIADDMIESTHLQNQPWHTTYTRRGKDEIIDYNLVLDDSVLSHEEVEYRRAKANAIENYFYDVSCK